MKCGCKVSGNHTVSELPNQLRPRFLSGLKAADLAAILSLARHRYFSASSVAIYQRDPAERLYMLTSGHGRHFVDTSEGRKVSLNWITPGQIFGGAAMVATPTDYLASTELLTGSCALVWNRQTIRSLISRHSVLLENVFSIVVTEHLAWMVATQVSLANDDARKRIAQLLLSLTSAIGKAGPEGIELPVRNEDLATGLM